MLSNTAADSAVLVVEAMDEHLKLNGIGITRPTGLDNNVLRLQVNASWEDDNDVYTVMEFKFADDPYDVNLFDTVQQDRLLLQMNSSSLCPKYRLVNMGILQTILEALFMGLRLILQLNTLHFFS